MTNLLSSTFTFSALFLAHKIKAEVYFAKLHIYIYIYIYIYILNYLFIREHKHSFRKMAFISFTTEARIYFAIFFKIMCIF